MNLFLIYRRFIEVTLRARYHQNNDIPDSYGNTSEMKDF